MSKESLFRNKPNVRCKKHPDAGIHFGEATRIWRCNYCNCEVQ